MPCNNQILDNDLLKYVDIIVPNETELRGLVLGANMKNENDDNNDIDSEKLMAVKLFDKGIRKAVIVTLGERGAMMR